LSTNKKTTIKTSGDGNVFVTKFHVTSKGLLGKPIQRIDRYVRWGWFEDNILSQYSSFTGGQDEELISTFRSIEPEITDDGEITSYRSVLIRNNEKYLIPKDVFAFFLPGQNIRFVSIDSENPNVMGPDRIPLSNLIGYGLDDGGKNHIKQFLSLNSTPELQFANPNDSKYGRLRNIMINVKEIQKAFGIVPGEVQKNPTSGQTYGTDTVNPPATLKAGVTNLLNALTNNFHNFWKFEISEDNFTKNIKIIETNSTAGIKSKRYTKFGTDENPNTNKVNKLGIYKFPSYTLGSMVKNQELSFSIPDSMAVTAMYGSNKSKTDGLVFDTSNETSNLATLFKNNEKKSYYRDKKLKEMDKAYKKAGSKEGHKIGNITGNPNLKITKDGGLTINPNLKWWHKWSESKGNKAENVVEAGVKEALKLDDVRTKFNDELDFIIREAGQDVIDANKAVDEKIKQYKIDNQPPQNGDMGEMDAKSFAASLRYQRDIAALENEKITTGFTYRYYQFVDDVVDDSNPFTLKLFDAGEAIVRTKLFHFDNKSSAYQTNFLIPAELGLTIDGTSGITPGDIIQTDYIQPAYNGDVFVDRENSDTNLGPHTFFQIFGLTQNLSSEGWTTEITTKMRMNGDVLEQEAGEIKFVPELKRQIPPPVKRPKIPVPSDEEDIADDLPLDELDFDDFSQMEGPPPPPYQTSALIDTDVEVIFGCMDDSPPLPGTSGFPDINGKNRLGKPWKGDDFETTLTGYLARNYDPDAQYNAVSETNLDNPCLYDDELIQERFVEKDKEDTYDYDLPDDLTFDEDDIVPRPVFGCNDPKAINYAGIGYLDEIDRGEIFVVAHKDSPCQFPPKQEVPSAEQELEDYEVDPDPFSEFDSPLGGFGLNDPNVNLTPPPPPPKPGPPIKILDTTKVEVPNITKKKKKKSIEKKKLEDVKPTEDSKKAQEQTGAPKDPPVLEGITRGACTDEQIALGYKTVVGYVAGVDDGLNVNNPEIYGKFVEGVGGGTATAGYESDFCDARDPIPPKPKIEEKKTPPVILSAPKPTFLKSTYFGGYLQNSLILYKVTPWFARGSHIKPIIFYGGVPKAGPHKGNRERYYEDTKLKAVSYFIRQKFWDEMIEAPNETGGSIFANGAEFGDGGFDGANNLFDKVQSDLFLSTWTLPQYTKGAIDAEFLGQDTLTKAGATWTPQTGIACSRYPVNGKVGTQRGYGYSSDSSKQGEKILISDYLP